MKNNFERFNEDIFEVTVYKRTVISFKWGGNIWNVYNRQILRLSI